ncbi:uncharacterized protein LOC117509949 [Thalassophryne amazonica]|uniref:uncharacterized protein LOC117509949 n=1 Tax=Thalassophryne amazonica TaxID=390379 RepID=UPI0014725BB0|nr:uncharacterized protein LOC117509949 [Thalassophryne amazonica]
MLTSIKKLKVNYKPVNERNIFTNGDCVLGQIIVEVAKECRIGSLSIKFKGKASVLWTEQHGKVTVVYHSEDKYFSKKCFFIGDRRNTGNCREALLTDECGTAYSSTVGPGCHVYPFKFHFPQESIPSSFKGSCGKIVYKLEASLNRTMRVAKKDSTKITFVSTGDLSRIPELMIPQHESKDRKMVFTSGTVNMDVNIKKMGYAQGESLKVLSYIQNNSSREIKPKYCVYSKHSFFAMGRRRVHTKDLLKEEGESIRPHTSKKVTQVINIPHDAEPSILNCSIIKAEYRLKVHLDVKFALNPEVKLPIVILPASGVPAKNQQSVSSGSEFASFRNPNQPTRSATATRSAAPELDDLPPPYEAHAMYPHYGDFATTLYRWSICGKKEMFRLGDWDRLRMVQREVKRSARRARRVYKERLERKLQNNNTQEVWRGMRAITGYKEWGSVAHSAPPSLLLVPPAGFHPAAVPPLLLLVPAVPHPVSVPPVLLLLTPAVLHPAAVSPLLLLVPAVLYPAAVAPLLLLVPAVLYPVAVAPLLLWAPAVFHPAAVPPLLLLVPAVLHLVAVPSLLLLVPAVLYSVTVAPLLLFLPPAVVHLVTVPPLLLFLAPAVVHPVTVPPLLLFLAPAVLHPVTVPPLLLLLAPAVLHLAAVPPLLLLMGPAVFHPVTVPPLLLLLAPAVLHLAAVRSLLFLAPTVIHPAAVPSALLHPAAVPPFLLLKMTIQTFAIQYDAINKRNTFTNGDIIKGKIILELSKDTSIQSIIFTGKGKAWVWWKEHHGPHEGRLFHAEETYYSIKQDILKEGRQDGTEVIRQGRHVFPFTFKVPDRKMPSTFSDNYGKVIHTLKAELKRSMRLTEKTTAEFVFMAKPDWSIPGLLAGQHGQTTKSVKVFGSGKIFMDAYTDKMGYQQGEQIHVTAEITNESSRAITPKFVLFEKRSFYAKCHTKAYTNELLKEKTEEVPVSGKHIVKKVITVPKDLPPSVLQCSVLKLEYRLKVYLDVKYATDPEVTFMIIILPEVQVPAAAHPQASAGYGFEAYGNPDQSAWAPGPQQPAGPWPMAPPPYYGGPGMYPPVDDYGRKS